MMSRPSTFVLIAAVLTVPIAGAVPQRATADAALAKLTTVLQDLAQAIPQGQSDAAAPSRAA